MGNSFLDILKTSTIILFSTVLISCGNVVGGVLSLINGIGGLFISGFDHIAGGSMLAMLGLQTIHLAFTSCNLAFGILTGILGLATLTFASSEIEEGITGDNYLKDNMPHWLYSTSMFVVVAATTLVNIVGPKFQCFKEGTLVKTKDGLKAIEEIKEGDLVYAYDEKTGKCAYKKVLSLSRNVTKKWCSVSLLVNGKKESIVSTPGHKYYLPFNNSVRDANEVLEHDSYIGLSNKWVSAKDLKCGDKVLLSDGSYGIIDSVIVNDLVEQEVTYNFEVEDFHTYFVGEYCVCVHNECYYRGGNKMKARERDVQIDKNTGLVKPTRGVSINSNINEAAKYGKPHLVGDIPDGLQIIHTAGTHYEIAPSFAMTMENYQELLYTVPLFPVS